MYFTLAVSAPDPAACADLTQRACGTDPRVMPIPGPARVVWRAENGCAALIRWGRGGAAGHASYAGTINATGETVVAQTTITRVDPVFVARAGRAAIIADRATWAAAVAGRLGDPDPLHYAGLLGPGYPLGAVTPFSRVHALGPATACRVIAGQVKETERARLREHAPAARGPGAGNSEAGVSGVSGDSGSLVAEALVAAVAPLRDASAPVELSLTGGKAAA